MSRVVLDFFTGMVRETGKVRTAMWCHDCRNDFSVVFDYDLNGNHVVNCPHCDHEHCRVIKDGVVTDDRWDSRNGAAGAVITYAGAGTVYLSVHTATTTASSSGTTSYFLLDSWSRTTT